MIKTLYIFLIAFLLNSCGTKSPEISPGISPKVVTEKTKHDTDDPAIWVNEDDPSNSLILGTDKDEDGALYVFDLQGNIIEDKVVTGLKRPNNVDVGEFEEGDTEFNIAAVTERLTNKIRIFSVPDMEPVDNGGIEIFEGEEERAPMGIALYKREADDAIFVIVSRKNGPSEGYLWQYRLLLDDNGNIKANKVREFGNFSGKKEIEAIAVDNELGYVYYSDEGVGVRKYHADPDQGDDELAIFATEGFTRDNEGISIYKTEVNEGYILVSDQEANKFHIFTREGTRQDPHDHQLVKVVNLSTSNSDGSEVTSAALGEVFPNGVFVAMSDDKTFQLYDWEDIAGKDLIIAPDGLPRASSKAIKPAVVTEPVEFDTDDPAIWINKDNSGQSLVVGTDKEEGGGLYVYDLDGKIITKITGMKRPNNVDIEYGLNLNGKPTDIAITTERYAGGLRIFSMPGLIPIDNGGIEVFEGEEMNEVMGLSIYKRPTDGAIFAIVGRKDGPSGSYLWQYKVEDDGTGKVHLTKVREFGEYSGLKEIEAIAVDDELGYVYYSDEMAGIRKYYADPDRGNEELAFFGTEDFGRDNEGIAIYNLEDGKGYILVSDQQRRNKIIVYPREGTSKDPHNHEMIKSVEINTNSADGLEVTNVALGDKFPSGLFVAMDDQKVFHYYRWSDIAEDDLKIWNKSSESESTNNE